MHADYKIELLKELRDQQVRFAPRKAQVEQVERAERLIGELDPVRNYSYDFLCFRITDFRPELAPHTVMSGEQASHDLRLFVEDVSDAADLSVQEADEPVHTVDELSKLFKVSTKTIARWREQGLVSRRFVFENGRKRVGFLHSSVERFVARNKERVRRGERFSQLTEEEKNEIVAMSRRLSRGGLNQAEVTRRVARHVHRSMETIRYTLRAYDERNPDQAIFPSHASPLTDEHKAEIYRAAREGESIELLAVRFHRTRSAVYRVINEARAEELALLDLDFMPNPEFSKPNAEKTILSEMPAGDPSTKKARSPGGLPGYLAALYEVPLLTREQEYHLFRKFNYLKFRAKRLQAELDPACARASVMDEIERLYAEAIRVKNQIVQANLRLVVSIAKRHVGGGEEFFDLVSDGNMSLFRAAEKFDYARGNKFSTYATWSIMKNFARSIPGEFKHRDRYRTSQDETFSLQPDSRTDQIELEHAQSTRERQIERILECLDEREQMIIRRRFGLEQGHEPLTLKEVGAEMGVTKERVRQIEARALDKLRSAAREEHIEVPE